MFNNIDDTGVFQRVVNSRLEPSKSTKVVLKNLQENFEFGQGFFHKILSKTILRPGSIQAK